MDFKDRTGTSVESLLAILRSAQGDAPRPPPAPTAGPNSVPIPNPSPSRTPAAPPATSLDARSPARNAQLADLLAQLDDSDSSPTTSPARDRRSSAFDGPTHGLIDPFGPVGKQPGRRDSEHSAGTPTGNEAGKGKGKRAAEEMDDPAEWGFTKCLPVLTELLRDQAFVKEVRKMKSDQDALERRLWARMEKIKAEHKARGATEREVARITRKPIPPEKIAKSNSELKAALEELFKRQVMPSVDGLAARHHARLVELGVPGLGTSDKVKQTEDGKARAAIVKRIMGVLESVLDS